LHKTQFTVCVRESGGERFGVYPTNDEGYEKFLEKAAAWRGTGQQVSVGAGSTGNTRYFKGRTGAAGMRVVVTSMLKFKVVNESVKKTDRHEAATIAEFPGKDMLPESKLCGRKSEQMRRLLKARTTLVRAEAVIKNQMRALLTAEGTGDKKASLQSKRGCRKVPGTLKEQENGLAAQSLFNTTGRLQADVKEIEDELRALAAGDRVAGLLMTIPGCGEISAWTIRAYTDDIRRFASPKKYAAYAGLVPWVQNSNETVRHGRITKRG
jgi:transposase